MFSWLALLREAKKRAYMYRTFRVNRSNSSAEEDERERERERVCLFVGWLLNVPAT